MRKEASTIQWKALYDVSIRLRDMEPWNCLWDMDLIEILLPKIDEPFYCSVMGKAGECVAIGVYKGYDAMHKFYHVADKEVSPTQLLRYQNNIMCYFGNGEELTSKEKEIIKKLGIDFDGNNQWIYFRAYETGYAPHGLDEQQVVELTLVLQQLYMALGHFIGGRIKVDFEGGKALKRFYEPSLDQWLNYEAPNSIPPRNRNIVSIEDQLLINRLKRLKPSNLEIELDTLYINAPISDKKFDKPILGNLILIADRRSGMLLNQKMISPKEDIIESVLEIFISYLMENGKPKKVLVRDEYVEDYLLELCKKIQVPLRINAKLKAIDNFEQSLMRDAFGR